MANGENLNEELEFNSRLKGMSLDDRSIFNAKQVYDLTIKFDHLDKKVDSLSTRFDDCILANNGSRKTGAISGGLSGGIVGAIIALIEYFKIRQ